MLFRSKRPTVKRIRETSVVVRHGGKVLVSRRGPGEWWEGLWDFPRVTGAEAKRGRRIGVVTYTVTHHRIECTVRERHPTRRGKVGAAERWVAVTDLPSLAMASPGRRIAALLERT